MDYNGNSESAQQYIKLYCCFVLRISYPYGLNTECYNKAVKVFIYFKWYL